MLVMTKAGLNGLAQLVRNGTPTTNLYVEVGQLLLVKAPFTVDENTVLGDLSEADYDGYARFDLTDQWTPVFETNTGMFVMQSTSHIWQPTGDTTFNIIYGHAIVGTDSITLLAAEVFDTAIPLNNSSFAFSDAVRVGFDPASNYGLAVIGA